MLNTLRAKGWFWVLGSLVLGILATIIWMKSQDAWQEHLSRAYISGTELYDTLRYNAATPPLISIDPYVEQESSAQDKQLIPSPENLFTPAYVTSVFLNTSAGQSLSGGRLQFHIISPDLRYPISKLDAGKNKLPSAQLGEVTRLLASYCSNPLVFARVDNGDWLMIEADKVWGCDAAPLDLRLLAGIILVAGSILFLSQVTETSAQFNRFSIALRQRQQTGGTEAFKKEGPLELQEIKDTLNEYLALERDRLEKRAMVMSGVSHDLGTPATRLRLRTALIEDQELRNKLEADIDQMTDMIEGVLTYTRSEMNSEKPRQISLTSLVQSIVADYADVEKPVKYSESPVHDLGRSHSVFGRGGNFPKTREELRRTLITARPIAIRRAITNLIDNSLKYGRKATVSVISNSGFASVVVEDEGSGITEEAMNSLTAPFLRGDNANYVDGVGLGLTIVSTIARQHGGNVSFEKTSSGLRSTLTISR